MGTKERLFSPLPHNVSLEDLVPEDNFYRRLEKTLDLSFVRDLVRPLYARGGRPSVDPVVFFYFHAGSFLEYSVECLIKRSRRMKSRCDLLLLSEPPYRSVTIRPPPKGVSDGTNHNLHHGQ
jgi:hypothetical protein